MKKNESPIDISFLLGVTIERVDQLRKEVDESSILLKEIESLRFWNRIFLLFLTLLGTFVIFVVAVFWRHPEAWLRLVELLK